jgi:hypothetical protein
MGRKIWLLDGKKRAKGDRPEGRLAEQLKYALADYTEAGGWGVRSGDTQPDSRPRR